MPIDYLLFLQIVFFLCITPGTPRILIITHTINYGLRKSLIVAFGDVSANIIQMIFVALGIGTIILANPGIMSYGRFVGVIYLLYLAFDINRSSANFKFHKQSPSKNSFSLYRDGFIVAFFSPKAWFFFGVMFPQFLNPNENFKVQLIILIFSYVMIDFTTLILYGFIAKKIITWLKTNPKTINLISSFALLSIAVIFALI